MSGPSDSYAERLRVLLDAGIFVSGELHLDEVLDRIVQTACHVIGARYGALGVLNEDGTGLSNFVYQGISPFERDRIGNLPVGRGLLGALITDPHPIRLADVSSDPRSVGFPANHPPMTSFLGVPVRARGKVFGNLYLTEKDGAPEFDEEDERLTLVLADQAGVAIENARLYEEARRAEAAATRRGHELELVTEVGSAILAELDHSRVLRLIAQRARELVEADNAMLALYDPIGDEFVVRVAAGSRAGALEGMHIPAEGSLSGLALKTLEPVLVGDVSDDSRSYAPLADAGRVRAMLVAPLIDSGEGVGVLTVGRAEPNSFGEDVLFVVARFADLASIALQNARAVASERERAQLQGELAEAQFREAARTQTLKAVIRAQEDERQRIARELHDSFGQALASILLGLKVIEGEDSIEQARERIAALREVTAAAASDVRRIAFELRPTLLDDLGLGAAVERYAGDVQQRTGMKIVFSSTLESGRFDPDVETVVYRVAQEAITNAIKSSGAQRITVSLEESGETIRLAIADDGRGFDMEAAEGKGLGLLGMRERAEIVGGKLSIRTEEGEGTTVELSVPPGADSGS